MAPMRKNKLLQSHIPTKRLNKICRFLFDYIDPIPNGSTFLSFLLMCRKVGLCP